ncbi:vegetative cell wall protein gp1-like [Amblyraja radiata]|uniref:vegetative cell wall protein gp1-like n=1 Tax=Amblyraja radiata TaxID=386614 RepID=UPI0014028E9B|nr:vegetative cell wall protein gp1-like [Amblyraja radiata]
MKRTVGTLTKPSGRGTPAAPSAIKPSPAARSLRRPTQLRETGSQAGPEVTPPSTARSRGLGTVTPLSGTKAKGPGMLSGPRAAPARVSGRREGVGCGQAAVRVSSLPVRGLAGQRLAAPHTPLGQSRRMAAPPARGRGLGPGSPTDRGHPNPRAIPHPITSAPTPSRPRPVTDPSPLTPDPPPSDPRPLTSDPQPVTSDPLPSDPRLLTSDPQPVTSDPYPRTSDPVPFAVAPPSDPCPVTTDTPPSEPCSPSSDALSSDLTPSDPLHSDLPPFTLPPSDLLPSDLPPTDLMPFDLPTWCPASAGELGPVCGEQSHGPLGSGCYTEGQGETEGRG